MDIQNRVRATVTVRVTVSYDCPVYDCPDDDCAIKTCNQGTAAPLFGPCLLSSNGWMDQDAIWYGLWWYVSAQTTLC